MPGQAKFQWDTCWWEVKNFHGSIGQVAQNIEPWGGQKTERQAESFFYIKADKMLPSLEPTFPPKMSLFLSNEGYLIILPLNAFLW